MPEFTTRCNACNGLVSEDVIGEDEHTEYLQLRCANCGVLPKQPGTELIRPKSYSGDVFVRGVKVGRFEYE